MTDTATSTLLGGKPPIDGATYHPTAGENFPPGTPVCQSGDDDGTVLSAQGDSEDTAAVTGIAIAVGVENSSVLVKYAGPIRLTAAQWDVITGETGGLTRQARYFLSSATAGKLTQTAPVTSGEFVTQVGIALSATDLMIQIGSTVENPSD